MRMTAWLLVGALMLGAAPASADELSDLIGGIQAKYGKAKDLTMDFEQVMTVKQMGNREQKASGVIYFARPNKMRWVYKTSPAKEIITDGASLVLYYVDEKKAYLTKSAGGYNVGLPMAVLAGEVDVKTQYAAELLDPEAGRARIKLVPQKPMGLSHLVLHVSKQGFLVEGVDTVDAYGNVTRIRLKNQRFNTGVSTGMFSYTPKPGVEIIDAPITDM